MNPSPGLTLGSRYTLTERIAAGGMGEVWKARDSRLEREVAVKVMRPSAADEQEFVDRFRDEARHTAALSHPNIATVYDYGEDDGNAFLVMELVDGLPLSRLIARGAMNPERVRSIMGQAALALAAAHDQGVVHRDVKPANILVTPEGRVKLTDFGIASAGDGSTHTKTGEVLGTPHYLSPEQATGKGATGASDLYALGIVAHEMLTGRKPFEGTSAVATALMQVNDAPPPLPPGTPPDLRAAVERCLDKDPDRRPESAAALAASLGVAVGGFADAGPATSVIQTGWTDPEGTAVVPGPGASGTTVLPAAAGAAGGAALGYGAGYAARPPQDSLFSDDPTGRAVRREPEPERRSRAWLWVIPVVVALVAIAFLLYEFNHTGTATPTPTTTAPAVTSTSTAPPSTTTQTSSTSSTSTASTATTASPPPSAAVIDAAKYLGKREQDVLAALNQLGFTNVRTDNRVPNAAAAGTVIDIQPRGNVAFNNPVELTISSGPATTSSSTSSAPPTTPPPSGAATAPATSSTTPVG